MTIKAGDATTAELRQAIATAKGGRRNGHVPEDVRKRAVELHEANRARGTKARETAAALGVHETTLLNWERERRTAFRPARIVSERDAVPVVTKQPSARTYRLTVVDGLDVTALAALLKGMA